MKGEDALVALSSSDYLVVALYMCAVLVVGYRAARRQSGSPEDYLLAGRRLTLPMFVATLVSSWYGGILGVGEFSYRYGLSQWVVFGVPYYVFAFVFAFALASRVHASKAVTIPDRLRDAYGPGAAYLGAFYAFLMTNPAPYMLMVAVLLQLMFGGSLFVLMLVGTLISTIYLRIGGFRSVTATNYLEFGMMYLGFALLVPFCIHHYGGMGFLRASLPELHLTWHGGNSLQSIVVWFFIALWTLVDPGFHQRCEAATSGTVARWGILVSIAFWFVFDAMTVTSGLYARAILPNLDQPSLAYPALASVVLPPILRGVFFVGMLATIMSTLVSFSFIAGQTLGRDLIWRAFGGDEIVATRLGLLLALFLGGLLALILPSVVDLWYAVGSAVVPGLLIPLLSTYWFPLRMSHPRLPVAMMALSSLASLGSLLWGHARLVDGIPHYPFGIEPFYPGLFLSGLMVLLDRVLVRRAA